ncbi:MAG: hypothetical protein JW997_05030 [Actinobacteria bacterium]|nr:hypothetical protein [Actinomycetota bacterium]
MIISFVFSAVSGIFLSACKFEPLGLTVESQKESQQEMTEATDAVSGIFTEQYFYELKSKQANKNPLNDINIRKAIFFAIDRKRIIEELFGNYNVVLNSIFNNDSKYYYPAWDIYSYNPGKAKELLKTAGYDINNPLYLTLGASQDSNSRQIIQDIVKENLEAIGIKVWNTAKESREWYVEYVKSGNYELGLWAIYTPDFNSLINYFSSNKIPPLESDTNRNCNNYYWYDNKEFESALNGLLPGNTDVIDMDISNQAQNILAESAFILPLYSRVFCIAYNKKISGIEPNTDTGSFLSSIGTIDIISDENNDEEESEKGDNPKSLVTGFQQEPYLLNPLVADNIYRDQIINLIVRGLWKKDDSGVYEPDLVESVGTGNTDDFLEKGDDLKLSLKATIKLKDNIYWQDGDPITAYDVVATVNAIKEDESLLYKSLDFNNISSLEAIDDKEFSLTLKQYSSNWKEFFSIIFPQKMVEGRKLSEMFSENIFGSGPYMLKEWIKGEHIIVESNPYYEDEKPQIDAIKFIFNSDINNLISLLNDGSIDILNIPADLELLQSIEEDEELGLIVKPGNLWEHLAICLKPKQEQATQ